MTVIVDRFDGDHTVLRTNDGRELRVATTELPAVVKAGDVLIVRFEMSNDATSDRTQRAKDVLNEILGEET
ncbi:MAG: DUF3006 domain-containing protein [bacterium]|nr:DUF3006 domain-containing protein [bacterium]